MLNEQAQINKRKVYDCFLLFNELDLLEIRLNELNDVVDIFVIIEANRTFQGKLKPYYYEENQERFKAFAHKIRYVKVKKFPRFTLKLRKPKPFDIENFQREHVRKGLHDAKKDDVLLLSDIDEIPKSDYVKAWCYKSGIKVFEQQLYYYYVNYICTNFNTNGNDSVAQYTRNGIGYWRGTVMVNYKNFCGFNKTRFLRNKPESDKIIVLRNAGWHFSYLGGVNKVIEKLESYAHVEHNNGFYKNQDRLKQLITEGKSLFDELTTFKVLPNTNGLPIYIQKHKNQFLHLFFSTN